jgi:hypothetical protein
MFQTTNIKSAVVLLFLAFASAASGLESGPDRNYGPSFKLAVRLGGELRDALPQKFFIRVDPQVIALQAQEYPVIFPVETCADHNVRRQVELSAGFIDLINHLCHAKAIDNIQAGYFDEYVDNLARVCAANPQAPLPRIVESRYWSDEVINDQMSYFNQMMGMIMAINMAHHYLGHYDKYAAQLAGAGGKVEAINDLLTTAEWEVSVKAGALDGLRCALSTDGLCVLFEALDRMPIEPAWRAYVAPRHANFKKLNKDLARYEKEFFRDRLKLANYIDKRP